MKMRNILLGVMALSIATSVVALEKKPVDGGGGGVVVPVKKSDNQDACGAALCLAGAALSGKSPTGCDAYIRKYFEQQVITSGGFNPSKTFKVRRSFLNQCKSADENTKNNDNNKYGRARGL